MEDRVAKTVHGQNQAEEHRHFVICLILSKVWYNTPHDNPHPHHHIPPRDHHR